MLTALYFRVLNVAPDRLDDPQRDIYIQSKGHAVGCYYCVLAEAGFFPVEWLETYQHANSHLPGHPVRQKTPGIELNTGALGHGFACCGGAGAGREEKQQHPPHFLITGDGELAEGSNWEAAPAAAHYGLDNLVIINDKNNLQLAGPTREIMNTDPLADKWRAFGMEVSECRVTTWPRWSRPSRGYSRTVNRTLLLPTPRKARGSPLSRAPGVAPPGAERRRDRSGAGGTER
ncbi:hypothetical protein RBI80_15930 [Klebsiella variicola]|nr:hypothetical protein RBI80_15930 [Klebsiella variicola]